MLNKIEHLPNELTVIYCTNTKKDIQEEVYIDTQMFNYIAAFNVEWKIWDDSRGKKDAGPSPKVVEAVDLEHNNKIVFLRRIIGEYLYGENYHFSLLNEEYFDLRNANIFKFRQGTGHSGKVRAEKTRLLSKLPKLTKKNDINISGNNVNVIEYEKRLLLVEKGKVINEITFDQANAVTDFLKTH